jgi:hypothetical protein
MKLTRRKVLIGGASAAASAALPRYRHIEYLDARTFAPQLGGDLAIAPRRIYWVRGGPPRTHRTYRVEHLVKIANQISAKREAREAIVRLIRARAAA